VVTNVIGMLRLGIEEKVKGTLIPVTE